MFDTDQLINQLTAVHHYSKSAILSQISMFCKSALRYLHFTYNIFLQSVTFAKHHKAKSAKLSRHKKAQAELGLFAL